MSLTEKVMTLVKVIPVTDPEAPIDLVAVVPNWVTANKGQIVHNKHRGYAVQITNSISVEWLRPFECIDDDGAISDLIEALLYCAGEDEEKAISLCESKGWWDFNLEPHEQANNRPCTCGSGEH